MEWKEDIHTKTLRDTPGVDIPAAMDELSLILAKANPSTQASNSV